jgi:hypothetical protein
MADKNCGGQNVCIPKYIWWCTMFPVPALSLKIILQAAITNSVSIITCIGRHFQSNVVKRVTLQCTLRKKTIYWHLKQKAVRSLKCLNLHGDTNMSTVHWICHTASNVGSVTMIITFGKQITFHTACARAFAVNVTCLASIVHSLSSTDTKAQTMTATFHILQWNNLNASCIYFKSIRHNTIQTSQIAPVRSPCDCINILASEFYI